MELKKIYLLPTETLSKISYNELLSQTESFLNVFIYKDKKIDWHCDGYFTNADIELFVIFSANNGKSNILYSDYHGDIKWSS